MGLKNQLLLKDDDITLLKRENVRNQLKKLYKTDNAHIEDVLRSLEIYCILIINSIND